MTTETFHGVEGRDVIASDTAASIGEVKGFVLDRRGRSIEAVHVRGRGRRATLLDWAAVTAFGPDVVMAGSSSDPGMLETEHRRDVVEGRVAILGARVLTVAGHDVGTVDDVEFDTGSGAVVRVLTPQGSIGVSDSGRSARMPSSSTRPWSRRARDPPASAGGRSRPVVTTDADTPVTSRRAASGPSGVSQRW